MIKKINEKDLHFILESGVLAPSSHGFEPWKFVVLEQKEHNLKLSTLCYNQQNVASASHNIIFLARKDLQSCRRKNKISIWKNKTSIKVEILFFYKP